MKRESADKDYGEHSRKVFLEREPAEQLWELMVKWLLVIGTIYFLSHMMLYLTGF